MAVGVFTWPNVTETVAATPLAMSRAHADREAGISRAELRQVSVLPAAVRVGPALESNSERSPQILRVH